jgi:penicillin-binding protein 1C
MYINLKYIYKIFRLLRHFVIIVLLIFTGWTIVDFSSPYADFHAVSSDIASVQILDRTGQPLTFSYLNLWNNSDVKPLHELPEFVQNAFILSEDKRFFEHKGVDWLARGNALVQRLTDGKVNRGASTITEQVVRMLHPRKRTLWSKWIEGLEALSLEMRIGKAEILEFYLNQVPYASNRRGVVQASRYYFNRDIATLNVKEMLALAILVRAPSKFDLFEGRVKIEKSIHRLAKLMLHAGKIDESFLHNLKNYDLALESSKLQAQAPHFVDYVRRAKEYELIKAQSKIVTTVDGNLQNFVYNLLQSRLKSLASRNISHAAALVVDHRTHEIIAWVSVGAKCGETNNQASGCKIDMVTVPRQPASALKPFLYATAIEKGWTPATIIDDSPFSDAVGNGIHHFHNYSNTYYGKVTLRTALGNSLNIPAIHTINYVTPEYYLSKLHALGFSTLRKGADFYDDGLALGNGEVSLFELVQAYAALPNKGLFEPLKIALYLENQHSSKKIYSEEVTSIIGHILSDPWARILEFGRSSVLNIPTQTAVKTGTSTDYRDAWAIGYNHRYVVGIWMGNADYTPTDGITGSLGPSLALRGIFNELSKNSETAPLYLSPKLSLKEVCIDAADIESGNADCSTRTEYFLSENQLETKSKSPKVKQITITRPSDNLEMAFDPRIPSDKQAFEMRLSGVLATDEVEWIVDDKKCEKIMGANFLWPTKKGKHIVYAKIWRDGKEFAKTNKHRFVVK